MAKKPALSGHPGLFLLRIPQQAIEPYGQFGRADRFENIVVDAEESRLAHIEVIGAGREQGDGRLLPVRLCPQVSEKV